MKLKTCPARVKAAADGTTGEFEAIVSVFNNFDTWGDVVLPGAFADTIAEWKAGPDTLPVLWSHRMDDPQYNIGGITDIAELQPGDQRIPEWADPWVKDNGGLWVKAELDTYGSGTAAMVWNLLVKRRVTQFSYAYDVIESRPNRDGNNELLKLWVYEIGPTPIGSNSLTELIAAKSTPDQPDDTPETPPRRPSAAATRLLLDLRAAELSLTDA